MSRIITSQEIDPSSSLVDASKAYAGVMRSQGFTTQTYIDIEPSRSVRPQFTKRDYTSFRSSETVPSQQKKVIKMCMDAYDNVGIIRNVIDLMSDFASQGMTIVHPTKSVERFYRAWFEKIKGNQKSERFLNYLYRTGNVVIRRTTAKLSAKQEKELKKSRAKISEEKLGKREVPWGYEFLNPLVLDFKDVGGVMKLFMTVNNETYSKMVQNMSIYSQDVQSIISKGGRQIPLSEEGIRTFFYKKDDWLLWANPMIRPILDDIVMLEKMKLADLAALDGAISNVRLWTVGDLEHKIMPKRAIIDKLRDILASNVGGGTLDLIWGPDLKFTESNSQIYKFLGSEKYGPVLTSIYGGLGIPLSLTGSGGSSGYTNNFVSLKALIERLEYGRQILLDFWNYEFKLVQKSMGFSSPAKIHFDTVVLSDESAVKKLFIDLWDRNIISDETVLERFKEVPEIERKRKQEEYKAQMQDPDVPRKAGPYHSAQHREEMVKLALQQQVLDVEEYFKQIGVPSQKRPESVAPENGGGIPQTKKPPKTSPQGGRPEDSKDSVKRKQKRVVPKTSGFDADLYLWAMQAQNEISEKMTPVALAHFKKKNVRSLTKAEFDQLEDLKLSVLLSVNPYSEITDEVMSIALNKSLKPSAEFLSTVQEHVNSFIEKCYKKPTVDDLRTIYAVTFAQLK